ncbi:sigma-70 family RNA polymerase sigma factor [Kribbella sp. NPDC026596]|uniref:sigma-70 family RNA polymerase sigma factor n=1 Tax=Kribbella sp. NPDC026596 TaxID=3155122 RepID=UPI0033E24951
MKEERSDLDEALATFVEMRPRLMAIAYRLLGSRSEAEDVVQETWLRWQKTDRTVVSNPQALLATMTTRLAINVRNSARRRHETLVDRWAPEAGDAGDDPAAQTERREAVEQAVRLMMARLTPSERAAYVLREAFGYPYRQISERLQVGVANARQLVTRARAHLAAEARTVANSATHEPFLHAFLNAAQAGEFADLDEVLAADLAA